MRAFRHPRLQVVAQHVLIEQLRHVARLLRRPDAQHIVGRDETKRRVTRALHAPGQQHAQRLMRVAALEAVRHQVPAIAAQETSPPADHCVRAAATVPSAAAANRCTPLGKQPPARRVLQQPAHAVGEVGGQRQPAAFIGRHHRLAGAAIGAFHRVLVQPQEAQQASGEHERVARTQQVDEILFHLAQHRAVAFLADQAHLDQRCLDNRADVHAVLSRDALRAHMHAAFAVAEQLAPTLVGGERVTAILHVRQHVVEVLARQRRIWRRAPHLGVGIIRTERCANRRGQAGAAPAHQVHPAAADRRPVRARLRQAWRPRIPAPRTDWPGTRTACDASSMR